MDIKSILILAFICISGAISPGPSLAVVIRNTIKGGRSLGVMTGLGHGLGLTVYASIAITGLSSILLSNKMLFMYVQLVGAFWLIWIGYNMILSPIKLFKNNSKGVKKGFIEGFMISFLNPKILVFFIAVFSQFIYKELTNLDKTIIVLIAGLIDTFWYVLVALLINESGLIDKIKKNSVWIDKATGVVIIIISSSIIINILDF